MKRITPHRCAIQPAENDCILLVDLVTVPNTNILAEWFERQSRKLWIMGTNHERVIPSTFHLYIYNSVAVLSGTGHKYNNSAKTSRPGF